MAQPVGSSTSSRDRVCWKFYADHIGRSRLAPGTCFRILIIWLLRGIDSEKVCDAFVDDLRASTKAKLRLVEKVVDLDWRHETPRDDGNLRL
jgi:hypothetical protein